MGTSAGLDMGSATADASVQHDKQLTDEVATEGDCQSASYAVLRKHSVEQEPQRWLRLFCFDCCAFSIHIWLAPHLVISSVSQ